MAKTVNVKSYVRFSSKYKFISQRLHVIMLNAKNKRKINDVFFKQQNDIIVDRRFENIITIRQKNNSSTTNAIKFSKKLSRIFKKKYKK